MHVPNDSDASELWRLSGLGIELTASIAGMALLGFLLDKWWGTLPWMLIACLAMGFVGGGYNFIRQAVRLNKSSADAYRRAHPTGPRGKQTEGPGGGPKSRNGKPDDWFERESVEPWDGDDVGDPPDHDKW